MSEPVQRPVIEDLESADHVAVSATGTHVMALAAGAVAIVALVASIASGSTIIPVASLGEGDRTTATLVVTPAPTPVAATPVLATSGPPGLAPPISARATLVPPAPRVVRTSPCDGTVISPMEAVHRMFDQTISGPTEFSKCWTPGRAPQDPVLASYMRARTPDSLTTEHVSLRFVSGQLLATVTVRGWWQRQPPMGWANGESRYVVLRQQPDGSWTVDSVVPNSPEG